MQLNHNSLEKTIVDSLRDDNKNFIYMRFVALIYMTLLMSATIMSYRVVLLGPFAEPGSTLIYTFSFFWASLFAEVYGPNQAKKLIWESIICGLCFAILIDFINLLPEPNYWHNKAAYDKVVGRILRFTAAGTMGHLISAFLNTYFVAKWKYKMHGQLFWLRSLAAAAISEMTETLVSGTLTFIWLMPFKNIMFILINAVALKLIYGILAVVPTSFFVYLLKAKEAEVTLDPTFNPLKFKDADDIKL